MAITTNQPRTRDPIFHKLGSSDEFEELRYPLRLESSQDEYAHSVVFYIADAIGSTVRDDTREVFADTTNTDFLGAREALNGLEGETAKVLADGTARVIKKTSEDPFGSAIDTALNGADRVLGKTSAITKIITRDSVLGNSVEQLKKAIVLYMPQDLSYNYTFTWNSESTNATRLFASAASNASESVSKGSEMSFAQSFAAAAETVGAVALEALERLPVARTGLNLARLAVNPKLTFLFQQVEPRTFTFNFVFSPRSKEELLVVERIIYWFKFYSHPETIDVLNNGFFAAPAVWKFDFLYKGQKNRHLYESRECACTNITTNYTPNSTWTPLQGTEGAPSQINLGITFSEITPQTREDIRAYEYVSSQGYPIDQNGR